MVDIRAAGRQSNGGIFYDSSIGSRIINNEINIPAPAPLVPGRKQLPYVFVGDEAFALSSTMRRPYPRSSQLSLKQKVFNYRLSRARRIVETAFGLLCNVWQVFKSDIYN